jgi:hypothetical protein
VSLQHRGRDHVLNYLTQLYLQKEEPMLLKVGTRKGWEKAKQEEKQLSYPNVHSTGRCGSRLPSKQGDL